VVGGFCRGCIIVETWGTELINSRVDLPFFKGPTRFGIVSTTFFILTLAFVTFISPTFAQNSDESDYTIIVTDISLVSIDSTQVTLAPDTYEWLNGWTNEQGWKVVCSSNEACVLTVRGLDETWDAPWPKPVGEIFWSYGGGEFQPLSTEPTEVCSIGPADHEVFTIQYKVALDILKDIPGEYFYTGVIFEISPL
jgi:hypothetical protein